MQYLGVIGDPDKRSLSPIFQQAALDALNLELKYEAWPTPPEGLATRVTGLRAPSALGANVTIPHKEAVLPMMDELDALAQRVGAVNTIVNRDGRLLGSNTDVEGFLRALRDDAGFDARDRRAVVAGAGGAARAVVVGLIEAGAEAIIIVNRTAERAEKLVADVKKHVRRTWIEVWPDSPDSWAKATAQSQLLVNCTSVGTAGAEETETPVPADAIRPEMLVYDLVYRPTETRLLREARTRGARVLGGLPMLIYQGAASFRTWTGQEAPVDVMFRAAREALTEETATP